jgi:hypothetical protein
LIIPFNYCQAYSDALRDVRDWFSSHSHAEFLKSLRINRKAVLGVLDAFLEYDMNFIKDKSEFDFSFMPTKDGYKALYRISPDDEKELALKIGEFFLKTIMQGRIKNG